MSDDFPVDALLPSLGFIQSEPGTLDDWVFKSEHLELSVILGPNKWMMPSANFTGHYNDGRTMRFIDFSIGKTVASKEQALALIAHHLDGLPEDRVPDWVAEGISLKEHLPWGQAKT